jgi:hypothetical protein
VEVLGSERGLEDEEVEVDLRRRRGQARERVGGCILLFGRAEGQRRERGWGFCCRGRSAFDDLVEARLCRHV